MQSEEIQNETKTIRSLENDKHEFAAVIYIIYSDQV